MKQILIFLFLSFSISILVAQTEEEPLLSDIDITKLRAIESELHSLSDKMINDVSYLRRVEANKQIIPRMVDALKVKNSYHYPFSALPHVSVIYAPDSTFRMITWTVRLRDEDYRYFGTLQKNSEEIDLVPLFDASLEIYNPEDTITGKNGWYGNIVYNILQKDINNVRYYFTLGWDGNNIFSDKKILDVFHFNEDSLVFGAPLFNVERDSIPIQTNRFILEYRNDASVGMNWDEELNMIVYDHLSPPNPAAKGNYLSYMPDGTYEGLSFDGKSWNYVSKVFTQTQDTPPIPVPLFKDSDVPKPPGTYSP